MPAFTKMISPKTRTKARPSTRIPLHVINAFTDKVGGGNPAAVCPLEAWLSEAELQTIAQENNRSETAFVVPMRKTGWFRLRWFTPTVEVDLCGHATLAAAHVLFEQSPKLEAVHFDTKSGPLHVTREDDHLWMDFPAFPVRPIPVPLALKAWLRAPVIDCRMGRDILLVLPTAEAVLALEPDFALFSKLEGLGLIVTAAGQRDVDFVSRFFAPKAGIPEDPVTGSAHCMLTPYWAEKTGKREFKASQLSARGGHVACRLDGDRVHLGGKVRPYSRGEIHF